MRKAPRNSLSCYQKFRKRPYSYPSNMGSAEWVRDLKAAFGQDYWFRHNGINFVYDEYGRRQPIFDR